MQNCTPERPLAWRLATSVRSIGAPRTRPPPGPAETGERWCQGPWSRSLRQPVAATCFFAQA
eukprot:6437375-Pyramimonas_sp.AAC.1